MTKPVKDFIKNWELKQQFNIREKWAREREIVDKGRGDIGLSVKKHGFGYLGFKKNYDENC